VSTLPPDIDPPRPETGKPPQEERRSQTTATMSVAQYTETDGHLADYPEEVREAIRMDRRRRAASLRLPPLPSGNRDPRDRERRDGYEAVA
jgi:hypothetical protein